MAVQSSGHHSVASVLSQSSKVALETKFTLKTDGVPDTRVLDSFSRLGFKVPESTYHLKDKNLNYFEISNFDVNAATAVVLISSIAITILCVAGIAIAPPVAALCFGGLTGLFLYLSSYLTVNTISEMSKNAKDRDLDPATDSVAKFIGFLREKFLGKSAPANYTMAQNEFETFITENGGEIRKKLHENIAKENQKLQDLAAQGFKTAEDFISNTPPYVDATRDLILAPYRITVCTEALEQLSRAEAAVREIRAPVADPQRVSFNVRGIPDSFGHLEVRGEGEGISWNQGILVHREEGKLSADLPRGNYPFKVVFVPSNGSEPVWQRGDNISSTVLEDGTPVEVQF